MSSQDEKPRILHQLTIEILEGPDGKPGGISYTQLDPLLTLDLLADATRAVLDRIHEAGKPEQSNIIPAPFGLRVPRN